MPLAVRQRRRNARDANYVVIPAMSVVALLLIHSLPHPLHVRNLGTSSPFLKANDKPTNS